MHPSDRSAGARRRRRICSASAYHSSAEFGGVVLARTGAATAGPHFLGSAPASAPYTAYRNRPECRVRSRVAPQHLPQGFGGAPARTARGGLGGGGPPDGRRPRRPSGCRTLCRRAPTRLRRQMGVTRPHPPVVTGPSHTRRLDGCRSAGRAGARQLCAGACAAALGLNGTKLTDKPHPIQDSATKAGGGWVTLGSAPERS